ncbi:TetR/AcrR family transcriptional regulator [Actinomycetospora endophytica]|uniref:TetR/AcrR family transcriptional regulator n=1 Tax=Actinomycetospora endophytica TaxID=2291215 RepID=A0ABS8P0I8_9PSEU|nr:TetR/AcrR family transcriptional regulator [Actinomycetospora endophytica]MCD2191776.1 TetR/AcrR family transcriptional regulator [Actinomycetospora endophytica]
MPKRSGPNSGPATRGAVLEAARRLFIERGFDGTSMRDIAAAVEVTNSALYYHFPSKEALLGALSQVRRDEINTLVDWAREQPSSPGLLRETGLRWLAGASPERLAGLRLSRAIRPVLDRVVAPDASVPGGFEVLVELFAAPRDATDRLRIRLVFDAFGAAADVADPDDGLDTIVAAARIMVLGLTAENAGQPS